MLAPRIFRASHPFVLAFVLLNINPQCLASNASLVFFETCVPASSDHAYLFRVKENLMEHPVKITRPCLDRLNDAILRLKIERKFRVTNLWLNFKRRAERIFLPHLFENFSRAEIIYAKLSNAKDYELIELIGLDRLNVPSEI